MTSAELVKIEFTGMRLNSITIEFELWITGEVVKTVSKAAITIDPDALGRMYTEYFGINTDRKV